jgi:hypothetical protein
VKHEQVRHHIENIINGEIIIDLRIMEALIHLCGKYHGIIVMIMDDIIELIS